MKGVNLNAKSRNTGVSNDGRNATAEGEAGAFRIFISYTHVDEGFRVALDKHLSPLLLLGRAEAWHDRRLHAGAKLYEKIQSNIESAHIVLMLISSDYLASKACQAEMSVALKKADEGTAVAIPIVVRACNWTILPIGSLLAANEDGKPINSQLDHDVAWTQVVEKIGELINDWQVQQPSGDGSSDQAPLSAAAEDEQSLKQGPKDALAERWVNRRQENDSAWEAAKSELAQALATAAAEDAELNVALNIRSWGDKLIVDFTLPQHRAPRRFLIHDVGGYVGYPGYQLEIYAQDERVKLDFSRVRWLSYSDGVRVLRQTRPPGKDMTIQAFGQELWRKIAGLAKSE